MNVKKEAEKFLVWKSYKSLQTMLGRYPSIVEIVEDTQMKRTSVIDCIKLLGYKVTKFTSQRGFYQTTSVYSESMAVDRQFDMY